jgi:uncharacterized membrane protein YbhN (UPF0104 family)
LAISVLLLAAIVWFIGFQDIINVVINIKLEFFVLALFFYILLTFGMAYRISFILSNLGENLKLLKVAPSNLAGLLASDFTPARIGYFFTAFSISSNTGIAIEKTTISILGPQLFDFLIKAVSAAILTIVILSTVGTSNILINALVVLVTLSGILFAGLLVFHPPFLTLLAPFEFFPFVHAAFGFLRRMHAHSNTILSIKWQIILITICTWTIKGIEWFFLSRALGIVLSGNTVYDLVFMMIFQAAITIIQFIPSPTIAGAGASEAAFAVVLLPFGVAFETAVAFGFLTRVTMIIVDIFSLPVIVSYLQKHGVKKTFEKIGEMGH